VPVYTQRPWQIACGLTVAAVLFGMAGGALTLANVWATRADYSHGFLVVPFAAYLLWTRRAKFPPVKKWPDPVGLALMLPAVALYLRAGMTNYAKEGSQGFALVLALAGVATMFCGRWAGLRWAAPALVLLLFTLPMPYTLEQGVSMKLRQVATEAGTFGFQALGLPAYSETGAEGHRIVIGETVLIVAQACGGLSMLLTFVTLAAGLALLLENRPWPDRLLVFASAAPIAVLCNIVRIIVTGLVYHAGWKQLGDAVVHDLAGWLMMPLALAMTWGVLKLIDWVVVTEERLDTHAALNLPTPARDGLPVLRVR
jgi:exosortase